MFVKWLGAGILLIAAGLLSRGLTHEHRKVLRELEALCDMVQYIRDNIDHLMKPLPEIFASYQNDYLETIGFLQRIRHNGLKQAWDEQSFSISGEPHLLLTDFNRTIGSGYRTEELRLCDYTLSRLKEHLDRLHKDSSNLLKLYKTVPVMFALSIILILI